MTAGSRDDENEGDKSDERDAIHTASRLRQPVTELERFDLGTSNVDGYEGEDGDDADADADDDADTDEEKQASQANDRSTQNVED